MTPRVVLLSFGLTALFSSTAFAFAPTGDTTPRPTGERIYTTNPHTQVELKHMPAWQRFITGEGTGWDARFDEKMARILTLSSDLLVGGSDSSTGPGEVRKSSAAAASA